MSEIRKNQTEKETKPELCVYMDEQGQYEVNEYPLNKWYGKFLFRAEEGAEWYCIVQNGYTSVLDIINFDADPDKWTDEKLQKYAKGIVSDYDYFAGDYSVSLCKCVIKCVERTRTNEDGEKYVDRDYYVDYGEIVREATATPLDSLIDKIEARIKNCDCHYNNDDLWVEYANNLIACINFRYGEYNLTIDIFSKNGFNYNFLNEDYEDEDDIVDMLAKFDID